MGAALNRRAMIGAIGMGAVAGTGLAVAPATANPGRAGWDKVKQIYLAAAAKSQRYHEDVFTPADDALDAAIAAVPHVAVELHGYNTTTADEWRVRSARSSLRGLKYVETGAYDVEAFNQAIADAADARDGEIQRLRAKYDIARLAEESDRLCDEAATRLHEAAEYPVPTLALLSEKIEFLIAQDDGTDWLDYVQADIRRLAGEA